MLADAPTTLPAPDGREVSPPDGASLALARRAWRRAGVRRADRSALTDEIAGEIDAAGADGYGPVAVLGTDPAATARSLAVERGMAGRSLQAPTMLWIVVGGVLLGSSTTIAETLVTYLGDALGLGDDLTPGPVVLTSLIASAVMAVLLPTLGSWAALHHRGDPRAGATARWLALLLPVGAMVGTLLALVVAIPMEASRFSPVPFMVAVLLAACAGAGLLARHLAVRFAPIPR